MANDLNTVAIVGRLTRTNDLRFTNSGYQICSFSIAVNKSRKQADGTWQEQAHFFECTYFGKAAEGVSPWLVQGQQVAIQGSLEQSTWEKDGQKHSKVVIIVSQLTLIGSKKEGNRQSGNSYQNNPTQKPQPSQRAYSKPQYVTPTTPVPAQDIFDDSEDIPF